jgi:hypothetical protein
LIGLKPYFITKKGQKSSFLTLFYALLPQRMQNKPVSKPSSVSSTQIPLWRQLQGAASLLLAVRDGQSMTAALLDVDATLRPGVQALGFHALRWLGRAEALRQQLATHVPALGETLPWVAAGALRVDEARGLVGRALPRVEHEWFGLAMCWVPAVRWCRSFVTK